MKIKQVIKALLKLRFKPFGNIANFYRNEYDVLYQFVVNNKKSINIYYYKRMEDLELEIYKETKNRVIKEKRYGYKDFKYLLDDVRNLLRQEDD